MIFSSITFLVFFLPLVLVGYLILKGPFRLLYLLLSSLFFYYFGEQHLIWIMVVSILADYTIGLFISDGFRKKPEHLIVGGNRSLKQKMWLGLSIAINLGLLVYFKYFNFFVDNLIEVQNAFGWHSTSLEGVARVALPLGISFYTFQSMSYTIDIYRGKVKANRNLLQFATYVTMFPQLVAGPIIRYSEMESQITRPIISIGNFGIGVERFVAGLAKKVLIADALAPVADAIFSLPPGEASIGVAWLGVIAFTLQIYFDFSGYSCMAIGLGRMLGFEFKENFNYPYIAQSLAEYWERWHISLTTWFRDYVYIPLGGSRVSMVRTYVNILIVFFISGLWHGTQWSNISWGIFHGVILVIERRWLSKYLVNWPKILRHLYLLFIILMSFVFFRSDSLSSSISMFATMFGGYTTNTHIAIEFFSLPLLVTFGLAILFSMPILPFLIQKSMQMKGNGRLLFNFVYLLLLMGVFVFCISNLLSSSYSPFIYFRF